MDDHTLEGNLAACLGVASAIATTLGPCGMDKLILCEDADEKQFIVSNDGATILRHLHIEHPAAKLFVELAISQDAAEGDGTTSAVLLAAGLLRNAQQLVKQGFHPTSIIEEYRRCLAHSIQIIHAISMPLSGDMLHNIARTSIGSKVLGNYMDYFSDLGVKAVESGRNIRVGTHIGNSMLHSRLIDGIVLVLRDRLPSHMSNSLLNPRVLVTSAEFMRETSWNNTVIKVRSYVEAAECATEDFSSVVSQCQLVVALGIQAIVALGPISPVVEQFFTIHKILLIAVKDTGDLGIVALCTNCEIVSELQGIYTIGTAHSIEVNSGVDGDVVKICGENVCTLELHAPSIELAQECKRSFEDMTRALQSAKTHPEVVGGGASVTLAVAHRIRIAANEERGTTKAAIVGRLAAQAFATACETIAHQLATNAGSSEHSVEEAKQMHLSNIMWAGIDSRGRARDMVPANTPAYEAVLEPAAVIKSAMAGAVDVTELILRIDRNIMAEPRAELV